MSEVAAETLEEQVRRVLRAHFEPLHVSLERRTRVGRYFGSWVVVLGWDASFTGGGLRLVRHAMTLHETVAAVNRLLSQRGRRDVVDQLAEATGGAPIALPEEWYRRPRRVAIGGR